MEPHIEDESLFPRRFMTDAARREQETMKKKATPKLSLSITGGMSRNSTATPPRHTSGNLTPPVTPPITPSSSFRSSTPTGTERAFWRGKTNRLPREGRAQRTEVLKETHSHTPFRWWQSHFWLRNGKVALWIQSEQWIYLKTWEECCSTNNFSLLRNHSVTTHDDFQLIQPKQSICHHQNQPDWVLCSFKTRRESGKREKPTTVCLLQCVRVVCAPALVAPAASGAVNTLLITQQLPRSALALRAWVLHSPGADV